MAQQPFTIAASAARTASGNSGSFDVDEAHISILVDVTAVSGATPTLDLAVLWSNDGTNFAVADGTADTLAQITTAVKRVKKFAIKGAYCQVNWTVAGTTPSFTFTLTALTTAA